MCRQRHQSIWSGVNTCMGSLESSMYSFTCESPSPNYLLSPHHAQGISNLRCRRSQTSASSLRPPWVQRGWLYTKIYSYKQKGELRKFRRVLDIQDIRSQIPQSSHIAPVIAPKAATLHSNLHTIKNPNILPNILLICSSQHSRIK